MNPEGTAAPPVAGTAPGTVWWRIGLVVVSGLAAGVAVALSVLDHAVFLALANLTAAL